MARNQTDWTNYDVDKVNAIHEDLAFSVPVYGDGVTEYSSGDVVTISSLSDSETKLEYVTADGDVVTHLIREDADDAYGILCAYVLQPGFEFILPSSALADGVSVNPGDELIASTTGKLKAKAQATDYVVFKALSDSTTDYIRVLTICGQTPTV